MHSLEVFFPNQFGRIYNKHIHAFLMETRFRRWRIFMIHLVEKCVAYIAADCGLWIRSTSRVAACGPSLTRVTPTLSLLRFYGLSVVGERESAKTELQRLNVRRTVIRIYCL